MKKQDRKAVKLMEKSIVARFGRVDLTGQRRDDWYNAMTFAIASHLTTAFGSGQTFGGEFHAENKLAALAAKRAGYHIPLANAASA